jgi:hypothetical protein
MWIKEANSRSETPDKTTKPCRLIRQGSDEKKTLLGVVRLK